MTKYFAGHGASKTDKNGFYGGSKQNWASDISGNPGFSNKSTPPPMTNHTRYLEDVTFESCRTVRTNKSNGSKSYGYARAYRDCPLPDHNLNELKAKARSKAVGDMAEQARQSNFNLGVTMAEGSKTLQMLADTATRLYNSFRSLRKGRIDDAFSALNISNYRNSHDLIKRMKRDHLRSRNLDLFAAKSWLELKYGWTPAIHDVYNAVKAVDVIMNSRDDDVILKGKGYEQYIDSTQTTTSFGHHQFTSVQSKCWSRYVNLATVSNNKWRNYTTLGLNNPALVIWELIPLSFVYDWFQPIGSYLQDLKSFHGLESNTGCLIDHQKAHTVSSRMGPIYDNKYAINEYEDGFIRSQLEHNTYVRVRTNGFPSVNLPPIELFDAMNGQKVLTALSLLRVFKG